MIAAIVGARVIPLARGVPCRNWTAATVIAVAALGLLLASGGRDAAVGGGVAAVLWATALSFLPPRAGRPPRTRTALG